MHLEDIDGMANSVDLDQTDLGLHCLLRNIYPNTKEWVGKFSGTDSVQSQISSKTPRGEKDSTK